MLFTCMTGNLLRVQSGGRISLYNLGDESCQNTRRGESSCEGTCGRPRTHLNSSLHEQVPSSHWRLGQGILPNVPSSAASLPPAQPASLISMMNAQGPCGGGLGGGCRQGHYHRQNPRGGGGWGGSETLRIRNSINII